MKTCALADCMSTLRGETSAAAVNAVYNVLQAFDCKGVMLQVNLDIFFEETFHLHSATVLHYYFIAMVPIRSLC